MYVSTEYGYPYGDTEVRLRCRRNITQVGNDLPSAKTAD